MDFQFIGSRSYVSAGTRNDIQFHGGTKDIQTIEGADYVKQKIVKALLTPTNSDVNFPTYGSTLTAMTFTNLSDPMTQNNFISAVYNTLTYIETLETSTRDDEHISSIDSMDLVINPEEQSVALSVVLSLRTGEQITLAVGS